MSELSDSDSVAFAIEDKATKAAMYRVLIFSIFGQQYMLLQVTTIAICTHPMAQVSTKAYKKKSSEKIAGAFVRAENNFYIQL